MPTTQSRHAVWSNVAHFITIIVLMACSCAQPVGHTEPSTQLPPYTDVPYRPKTSPTGPLLTEVQARALLATIFRHAGFRVRYDVPVTFREHTVVVDGWDPTRAVGFEYVALNAGDAPVPSTWVQAVHVLVLGETTASSLTSRAHAFLTTLASNTASKNIRNE